MALGWHTDDLDEVRREYRYKPQDNPVDYALFDFGSPRLFVEAKALGTGLDRKAASQVLGYAVIAGVGWCLLTNGDEYRLYNSHANVDIDEKLFRTVRLSDPEQEGRCLETLSLFAKERLGESKLESLWKSRFIDRRVKVALEALLSDQDAQLSRMVHKRCPELTLSEVRESLRRATVSLHFPEVTVPGAPVEVPPPGQGTPNPHKKTPHPIVSSLADLIAAGLIEPPLSLECIYKGVRLEATVEADGCVRHGGQSYDSLSLVGGMAKRSVVGGDDPPATNGWDFWRYCDPETGELRPIGDLRQRLPQGVDSLLAARRARARADTAVRMQGLRMWTEPALGFTHGGSAGPGSTPDAKPSAVRRHRDCVQRISDVHRIV